MREVICERKDSHKNILNPNWITSVCIYSIYIQ